MRVPTPDAAWTTLSSSARWSRRWRAPRQRWWGVPRPQRCQRLRSMSLQFFGRENWEGDNGNSIMTEDDDDDDADAEAGEYACNFLEVV